MTQYVNAEPVCLGRIWSARTNIWESDRLWGFVDYTVTLDRLEDGSFEASVNGCRCPLYRALYLLRWARDDGQLTKLYEVYAPQDEAA